MRFHPIRLILAAGFLAAVTGCATREVAPVHPTHAAAKSLHEARSKRDSTGERVAHYLQAAKDAETLLGKGGETAGRALGIYNKACAELALLLRSADGGRWWNRTSRAGAYRLRFESGGKGVWAPDYFTELLPTSAVNESLVKNLVKRTGVGGVLIGVRKTDPREDYMPRVGVAGPVSATVVFKGNTATFALRNPRDAATAQVGGVRFPLAADFSAPLCYYPDVENILFGLVEALNPGKFGDLEGLYFLEPYDPSRIPVIYVHGLTATPYLWRDPINEVNSDPELRKRYQAVVFDYPSGNPFAYSANNFRKALAAFEKKYPMPDGYVLVSHSMGGLLSRMQAQTVTRDDWRAVLGAKADELFDTEPYGPIVEKCAVFEADPNAKRIVFICTPHRGAKMADQWIGRIARSIIRVPSTIAGKLKNAPKDELSLFTGASGQLPTSVSSLAPENVTFQVLNAGTIQPPVHTIVGTGFLGRGPLEKSSDGVVAYWSSHLDYAKSEISVPTRHTFAPDHPDTTAELRRILSEHR
jgi:hypothetical protein